MSRAAALDPHLINRQRAARARTAVRAFARRTGTESLDEALWDLLVDLGHYAENHDIEFVPLVARALGTWAIELEEPSGVSMAPRVTIIIHPQTKEGDPI